MSTTHPVPPAEGDPMTIQDVDREISLDELDQVTGAGLWQDIENAPNKLNAMTTAFLDNP